MTNTELRLAVIAKLADSGVDTQGRARLSELAPIVEEATGIHKPWRQSFNDYLSAYINPPTPKSEPYKGEIVQPFQREWKPIEPKDVKPHWRSADIDAGQPPFMTPRGAIGNGDEHSKVWRR